MVTSKDFLKKGFVVSANSKNDFSTEVMRNHAYNNQTREFNISKVHSVLSAKSEDIRQLDQALQYLQQNPEAASVVKEATVKGVHIVLIKSNEGEYGPLRSNNPDGIIFWNPNISPEIYAPVNGKDVLLGRQSAANVLLHELIHATDSNLAKSDIEINAYTQKYRIDDPNVKYLNPSEYKAITQANKLVSNFHGEPVRPDYRPNINLLPTASAIDFQTNQYDKQGNLIGKLVQQYDSFAQTITRTHTDYEHLDRYGNPTVKQTVTDINGKPVKAVPEKHSFNYENPDWNSLTGSDLYKAVLSAEGNQLDMLGKSFAQSEEGQKMTQLGDRLWEDFKEQQELERQQELARSSRAMVRTL
ncbi:hypothetical protein [Neisseria dentiae]|uniref:hypothetical protein n=1 Tax=Neisseria dentiae TaxID=194197 RepID=UPI00359FA29A